MINEIICLSNNLKYLYYSYNMIDILLDLPNKL